MIPIIPNKRAKITENVMSSQANSLSVSAQSVAVDLFHEDSAEETSAEELKKRVKFLERALEISNEKLAQAEKLSTNFQAASELSDEKCELMRWKTLSRVLSINCKLLGRFFLTRESDGANVTVKAKSGTWYYNDYSLYLDVVKEQEKSEGEKQKRSQIFDFVEYPVNKNTEGYEKNGTRCVSFKSLLSGNFVCGGCYEQECRPRRVASKSGRPPLPSYKFTGNLTAKESVSAKYLHPKERQDLTKFMLISRSNKSFIIQSVVNKKYVKQSAEESETSDDEMSAGESNEASINKNKKRITKLEATATTIKDALKFCLVPVDCSMEDFNIHTEMTSI